MVLPHRGDSEAMNFTIILIFFDDFNVHLVITKNTAHSFPGCLRLSGTGGRNQIRIRQKSDQQHYITRSANTEWIFKLKNQY